MATNQLATISMITKESLKVLKGSLKFAANVNRDYNSEFAIKGAKIGQTVNIRKPPRYGIRKGPVLNLQSTVDTWTPLTLDQQYGIDLGFTSAEITTSLDEISDRLIKPAMATIASQIDAFIVSQAAKTYNAVGTPGTALASLTTQQRQDLVLNAGVVLDNFLAERDGQRKMLVSPLAQAGFNGAPANLFNPPEVIGEQYKTGMIAGNVLGFDWYMDQNMSHQDAPVYAGSPVVNTSSLSGSTITITGFTSGSAALPAGTIIKIAGVNTVNPQTKANLYVQQGFVLLDAAVDSSGTLTANVSPAIVTSGAFQNVTIVSPGAGKTVSIVGATGVGYDYSVAFHRDAFVAGWVELELPRGNVVAARETDPATGISVRLVEAYDPINDRQITRFDTLFGANVLYEQLACRVITS